MRRELAIGIALAGLCLLGALGHLVWFMVQLNSTMQDFSGIVGDLARRNTELPGATTLRYAMSSSVGLMRLSLMSSGVMIGLAFGFLGFALFVMGITDTAKLNVEVRGARVLLDNAAPGLIAIVVAAILIGVCVIQPVVVDFTPPPAAVPGTQP